MLVRPLLEEPRPHPLTPEDYHHMRLPRTLWEARVGLLPESARSVVKAYGADLENSFRYGQGLLICGGPESGKTHAAAIIAKGLKMRYKTVYFTTVAYLREAYRLHQRFDEDTLMGDHVRNVDALILDDLRPLDSHDPYFNQTTIESLIRGRGLDARPTIVTTRFSEKLAMEKTFPGFLSYVLPYLKLVQVLASAARKPVV